MYVHIHFPGISHYLTYSNMLQSPPNLQKCCSLLFIHNEKEDDEDWSRLILQV